jgi:hypothetical protein
VAEGISTVAARGAYPYLNLFVTDAELGVALEPNASSTIRSRAGRLTEIETDEHGRRIHASFGPKKVLLLGDSQAFGYHVDARETVAAELGRRLGATVVDAAVPSYGPHEYVAQIRRIAPDLEPELIVIVVNLANDWWEANVPNTRRSTARDGWIESLGRRGGHDFPGRRFLLGRSHLVLAMRRTARFATMDASPAAPARLVRDLDDLRRPRGEHRSRVTPFILEARRAAGGAEVVVVALPLDVMASDGEWKKYGMKPIDVAPLRAILTDLTGELEARGVKAIDLLPHLTAGSPGAFLDDDPHLSAKGHAIMAAAVAERVSPSIAREGR